MVKSPDVRRFDYLFPQLQNPGDLLPETYDTVKNLVDLGEAMQDTSGDDSGDAEISAAYTYFGQFVDHDITLLITSADAQNLPSCDRASLTLEEIRATHKNIRTAPFELDSVYNHPAPRDPENRSKMKIGKVQSIPDPPLPEEKKKPLLRPDGKVDENDLPRRRSKLDTKNDRAALIGDPRNDENTIISQLHLAFLLAHNELVEQGETYEGARKLLTQHYQHIVVHDFLKQIADPRIMDDILENGPKFYNPGEDDCFLPMEFSVAAFRLGHSMVRSAYDFNLNFNTSGEQGTLPATLSLLSTFSALSGQLGPGQRFETLPENWIIEWENFFDPQGGEPLSKARRFDTKLVEPLQEFWAERELWAEREKLPVSAILAVRNLLRGYILRMPTGQAVAGALGEQVLTEDEIREGAASQNQEQALGDGGFFARTPLWYYILVESAVRANGQRLGPVGSRIVAEVIVGLILRSRNSILRQPDWEPSFGQQQGKFDLPHLLRFAGVLRSS